MLKNYYTTILDTFERKNYFYMQQFQNQAELFELFGITDNLTSSEYPISTPMNM